MAVMQPVGLCGIIVVFTSIDRRLEGLISGDHGAGLHADVHVPLAGVGVYHQVAFVGNNDDVIGVHHIADLHILRGRGGGKGGNGQGQHQGD